MFNIEFPEYFSSIYHQVPSTKPKPNRKPRNISDSSDTPTSYTPSSNPKYPNFHYYNKKKRCYYDKNNSKQRVSLSNLKTAQPSSACYYCYHPVSTHCADYDNCIFNSIQYWSLFDSPDHNNHTTAGIASFVDSYDVLTHYNSLQHLQTTTIPPHYKSQPTAFPLY